LPFENLSPDRDNAYFADGLTEEIITDLSKLRLLRVISRNSAMQLKGTDKDTRTLGRELGVRYVLEGSVRRAGKRLRIAAQLIDAEDDTHIWAERYDGVLEDVFDMQERVSRAIVEALELTISPEEDRRLSSRPMGNAEVYALYLRARQETWLGTPEALARAEQYFKSGFEIVGDNALLYAGLGYVYWWYVNIGMEHEEYITQAEGYAAKALALDPESAEAHLVLGLLYQAFHGDQVRSFAHFKQALAVSPDDPHTLLWLIVGHSLVGRLDEARPLAERLAVVDPLGPINRWIWVFVDVFGGRLDRPSEELTRWLWMEPGNPPAMLFAVWFLLLSGRPDEVTPVVEQHANGELTDVFTSGSLMAKHAVEGSVGMVRACMTDEIRKTGSRDPQFSHFMADVFALAGMTDEALDWVENALSRGWVNYPFTVLHDPLLAPLRDDTRFLQLADRMKREWEQFDA
jgi:non-specific serine/threonine protein kinase